MSNLVDNININAVKKYCISEEVVYYENSNNENLKIISNFIKKNRHYPKFIYYQVPGGHDPWKPSKNEQIFGDGKISDYNALLRRIDHQFKEFVELLKLKVVFEKSIIIFTADHGISLGRHLGQFSYSNLYNVNMQIPFIIKIPGIKKNL